MKTFGAVLGFFGYLVMATPIEAHAPMLPICQVKPDFRVFTDAYLQHLALLYSDVDKRRRSETTSADERREYQKNLRRDVDEITGSLERTCPDDWNYFAIQLRWQNPELAKELERHQPDGENRHDNHTTPEGTSDQQSRGESPLKLTLANQGPGRTVPTDEIITLDPSPTPEGNQGARNFDDALIRVAAETYIMLREDYCQWQKITAGKSEEQAAKLTLDYIELSQILRGVTDQMTPADKQAYWQEIARQNPGVAAEPKNGKCSFVTEPEKTPDHRPNPYPVIPRSSGKTEV